MLHHHFIISQTAVRGSTAMVVTRLVPSDFPTRLGLAREWANKAGGGLWLPPHGYASRVWARALQVLDIWRLAPSSYNFLKISKNYRFFNQKDPQGLQKLKFCMKIWKPFYLWWFWNLKSRPPTSPNFKTHKKFFLHFFTLIHVIKNCHQRSYGFQNSMSSWGVGVRFSKLPYSQDFF